MLKTKKVLCVLLSLIMAFGTFSVAAFAATDTISGISMNIDFEAGMTINDVKEIVSITEGLEFNSSENSEPVYVYCYETDEPFDYDDVFENDVHYDIYFYFQLSEGYTIDDTIKYVTVNGKKTDDFYIYVSEDMARPIVPNDLIAY